VHGLPGREAFRLAATIAHSSDGIGPLRLVHLRLAGGPMLARSVSRYGTKPFGQPVPPWVCPHPTPRRWVIHRSEVWACRRLSNLGTTDSRTTPPGVHSGKWGACYGTE
jgi:hypothetical protein